MSDPTDEVVEDSNGNVVLNPKIRDQLHSQERQIKEMTTRLRASDLNAIYAELGVPSTGVAKLFRDNYQGEINLEAVRSAASEYDLLPKATVSAADIEAERQRQENLNALGRINNATDQSSSTDVNSLLADLTARLRKASADGDMEAFDAILASPDAKALGNQTITFS